MRETWPTIEQLKEQQKGCEFRKWLNETLPKPTPEQLKQLDERGDWIMQPDSQGISTVEQETT